MSVMVKNQIVTSKYNIINFIPLNILNQLKKAQNLYFIMVSYMQTVRAISISAGVAVQAYPLIAVMIASILKDLYEDYKRHKNDDEENNQVATRWDEAQKKFVQCFWKDIKVGNIIKLENDNFIPCDLLLLNSSDPKGVCYVETKSLDGETNLKMKNVHKKLTQYYGDKNLETNPNIDCVINCEKPNNGIYKFEGAMVL